MRIAGRRDSSPKTYKFLEINRNRDVRWFGGERSRLIVPENPELQILVEVRRSRRERSRTYSSGNSGTITCGGRFTGRGESFGGGSPVAERFAGRGESGPELIVPEILEL